jgi:uncharacterized protein YjbJ (UPF0337 family)
MDKDGIEEVAGEFAESAKLQAREQGSKAEASIQEAYGQAKDIARSVADGASGLASEAYDRGGQYLRTSNRAVVRSVGDNTLAALALAAGVGYFVSYLLHARR